MLRPTAGNRLRAWAAPGGFLPETISLINRFTTPPTLARAILINNLISALISNGIWQQLDALYVMAAADSQAARLNWIANAYNLTAVSSPTFTVDRGYLGDGVSSYLDTGFSPAINLGKMTQNSAHLSFWSRTDITGPSYFDVGSGTTRFNSRSTAANTIRGNMVSSTVSNYGGPTANSLGFFAVDRADAANTNAYQNGTLVGSAAVASTSLALATINVLRAEAGSNSLRQGAAASIGASISNYPAFYNALLTYMTAIGAYP